MSMFGDGGLQDQYILHTAEAQDITLPFSCRHGSMLPLSFSSSHTIPFVAIVVFRNKTTELSKMAHAIPFFRLVEIASSSCCIF